MRHKSSCVGCRAWGVWCGVWIKKCRYALPAGVHNISQRSKIHTSKLWVNSLQRLDQCVALHSLLFPDNAGSSVIGTSVGFSQANATPYMSPLHQGYILCEAHHVRCCGIQEPPSSLQLLKIELAAESVP